MQNLPGIHFLTNKQIDKKRWDDTIRTAANTLIYVRSFYLDNMCPGWSALAAPDYSWVLPLARRRKWGISYLYQPAFTQQAGVFTKAGVAVPYTAIIQWLQSNYRFFEVNWNYATPVAQLPNAFKITCAVNLTLNLSFGYKHIAAGYKKDVTSNLKRSKGFDLRYTETVNFAECINLFRKLYAGRLPHITNNDFRNFTSLAAYAAENKMLVCRQVKDENENIAAVALLLNDGKRLYNMMNATTPAGRRIEANYFLLDSIIKEFAGRDMTFDFEGSDVPGIKRFYENFGAVNQPYYMLKYNRLPWPVQLFKK